jgi:hypothetical protein
VSRIVILLEGALDYAGLFPPASLGMAEAVRKYASYRCGPHRALLGRFVVPIARLEELVTAADPVVGDDPEGAWELSVIGGDDAMADGRRIAEVEARHGGGMGSIAVGSVERKVEAVEAIPDLVEASHDAGGRALYLELPLDPNRLSRLVRAVALAGVFGKVRTGGTTVDSFPTPDALARFVVACSRAGLAFKATAGLHHALRGEYAVDGRPVSLCATMHGFLNLFVGAALLDAKKIREDELRTVLEERDDGAFRVRRDSARWRDREVGAEEIRRARTRLLHSVGTCSFEEPVAELRGLGALG